MISPSKMKQETSDSQDDGEEQEIPHVDDEEQEIPHVDGEEQEIPHVDGEEQEIPHVDGEEQEIPHVDGEEQEILHVDGEEQEIPHVDGEEQEIGLDLTCDEMDLAGELDQGLDKIQTCLRRQLPPISITSLDALTRANIIDELLCSEDAALFPSAVPLAVQLFDRYFASISQADLVNALEPRKVAECTLHIASKYFYSEEEEKETHLQNMPGANNTGTEFQIMNCVKYQLNMPTTLDLVQAFLSSSPDMNALSVTATLVVYLTKLALLDKDCSGFQIDVLASGCVFLAQFVSDPDNAPTIRVPWECDSQQLRKAVNILRELLVCTRLPHYRRFRNTFLPLSCAEIPDSYFEI